MQAEIYTPLHTSGMKNIFSIIILLVAFSTLGGVQAQSKNFLVYGKVISAETSMGIEGVSVHVKGLKQYTGSEPDGLFTIDVPKDKNILILELKGYTTEEITITCSKAYDIVLKPIETMRR